MAPKKAVPSPPTIYTPTTPADPDHEARLKAEARAYALSGSTSSSSTRRKSPPAPAAYQPNKKAKVAKVTPVVPKPTSLSIRRPEKQTKAPPKKIHIPPPAPVARPALPPSLPPPPVFDAGDDDYKRFVQSLGLDDSFFSAIENDDEDFHLSDVEDNEDDDDIDNFPSEPPRSDPKSPEKGSDSSSTPTLSSPLSSSPMTLPDFESIMYRDLEEELGGLLEEDMEAAVQSLMTSKKNTSPTVKAKSTPSPKTPKASGKKQCKSEGPASEESPATPLRDAARQGTRAHVTYQQSQQLRRLLTRHYQVLVQQSIMAVRAAQLQKVHKEKSDFLSGETSDDLAEILDGAVGMLQDLDQNRKDAIRDSIQLCEASKTSGGAVQGRRSLLSKFTESNEDQEEDHPMDRRLTRAAFTKTLEQQSGAGAKRTAFDIPGLMKLKETFATIDKSVDGVKGSNSILEAPTHADACRMVLSQAGANLDENFIPGNKDISENFCFAKEIFGDDFQEPCNEEQETFLRKNRNLFTSGEDNLVLRGVNLYGEKQWILIADRYLPDRSVNIISQRYSKLCVMLYKANGVVIDDNGYLIDPPKLESVDDIDEKKLKELALQTVEPPAILNVHRWSLEEDLTLLKAVTVMGHMWAELGARLIPHRDRGHLRKRYQVLERRVKATVNRSSKGDPNSLKTTTRAPTVPARKSSVAVAATKSTATKSSASGKTAASKSSAATKAAAGKTTASKSAAPTKPSAQTEKAKTVSRAKTKTTHTRKQSAPKIPAMSIEKAAASLTFLRPPPKSSSVPAPVPVTQEKQAVPPPPLRHPGKVIPTIKPPTVNRKPVAPKRSIAKLPFKAGPAQTEPKDAERALPGEPDCSRAGFEQLVNGAEDWSQMSRMKKMLENEDESQAADAIVSQLGRSPVPSSLSKLPQLHLDTNSMSGLSILQSEASRQANTCSEKPSSNSRASIMSRVLEGSSKSANTEKAQKRKRGQSDPFQSLQSPAKRPSKASSFLSPGPPTTPKRHGNFFSMSGTPIGLSPGFRPSPGMRHSITLTPNAGPYSPAPSTTMMRFVNEGSVDELDFACNFEISEESRRELEAKSQHDPTPPPLTPNKNSNLVFGEHELEAMSALNSLSNSPFRPKKRPEDEESKSENKSLFAAVIGGLKKDPKTKLQF